MTFRGTGAGEGSGRFLFLGRIGGMAPSVWSGAAFYGESPPLVNKNLLKPGISACAP
ncbi:hypothetical protein AmDm5_3078 [Acetobacter malorum]|nr:hypothetical protein AmDm5_3078 [Acetobacter malorum]